MKKLLMLLLFPLQLLADPMLGTLVGPDQTWRIVVADSLVGTAWERVTADTGFTQIVGDTTIEINYVNDAVYDSLSSGNLGVGTLLGVFLMADTGDETSHNNFFQDIDETVVFKSAAGVFGSGASPRTGARLLRKEDTQFRKAGGSVGGLGWTETIWARGLSAGNPGVGAPQMLWSVYESPDVYQVGVDQRGYAFFRTSDDGRVTWDSLAHAADIYDAAWHRLEWGVRGTVRYLQVDREARVTAAFSAAATAMTTDTLEIGAFRDEAHWNGYLDEAFTVEDTTTFNPEMSTYAYVYGRHTLGFASDSTMVRGYGLAKDSLWTAFADTVWPGGLGRSRSEYQAFERAYVDTTGPFRVGLFLTGQSPSSSRLGVIPLNKAHVTNAVAVAGKRELLEFSGVTATVHDPSRADIVEVDVRVYPQPEDAQGPGGPEFHSAGRRILDATDGSTTDVIAGPFSVMGPAVVEVWAKAAAGSSYVQVEMVFKRLANGR